MNGGKSGIRNVVQQFSLPAMMDLQTVQQVLLLMDFLILRPLLAVFNFFCVGYFFSACFAQCLPSNFLCPPCLSVPLRTRGCVDFCFRGPSWSLPGWHDKYHGLSGYYRALGCPAGYFVSINSSSSLSSSLVSYASRCTICPAGSFSHSSDSLECQACPMNTFAENSGAPNCTSCPSGYATPVGLDGQSICSICAPGFIRSLGVCVSMQSFIFSIH